MVKKKDKFRIVGLQAQVINVNYLWVCYLYVYFFVTSAGFLVIVCFLFGSAVSWVVHFLYACTVIYLYPPPGPHRACNRITLPLLFTILNTHLLQHTSGRTHSLKSSLFCDVRQRRFVTCYWLLQIATEYLNHVFALTVTFINSTFPGGKARPERAANHSPLSSAAVTEQ
jgi:hypothetical protein